MFKFFSNRMRVAELLKQHFGTQLIRDLVSTSRAYPLTARVDLQTALERFFGALPDSRLVGIQVDRMFGISGLGLAMLTDETQDGVKVGPLVYDDVDVGRAATVRCLTCGLWLARERAITFMALLTFTQEGFQTTGIRLDFATPPSEAGAELTSRFFDEIERLMSESSAYRGKIISLDKVDEYSGRVAGVRVHRLDAVPREEVVLPEQTLALLDRNVSEFVKLRERLTQLGMAAKKGLLFYGPPGTGKTHTIRYLAGRLEGHTTLLVTAEQIGLLDHYFQLARFLQPAMFVIEDVDLIARRREDLRSGCDEALLNKLLNQMDGLREDAAILFVLTTNHPEQIEAALASRPGRVDQAIEFPLPDEAGRKKLARLYARGLHVTDELLDLVVRKTKGASGAFIKEMMRRAAQHLLASSGAESPLTRIHIEGAIEEMVLSGGSLNLKLLGIGKDEWIGFRPTSG